MSHTAVAISRLGAIVTGKTPSTNNAAFFDGQYSFVTPSDLDWRTYYCRSTERTVTDSARQSYGSKFVPAKSVMVTCIGNTIGKCAISANDCLTNQQINTIVPGDGIDPLFVYYLLVHNTPLIRGVGLGGGAATPSLKTTLGEKWFT
ncbi:restriction endonuclease subunit S [Aeoliella sp. ICT_H6.2]|uniref:Restriction endonuclease subunit S n=1 Tax=Aeoliella straminimaris TaxID=2954799 RepID=A0A9X2FGD8_9BACT|nr:restriction endonuclease subunit S [Aeoliella straminimaris]MCO6045919.1 restriction endonuclease subunit S [Aeoliella straminimaris]